MPNFIRSIAAITIIACAATKVSSQQLEQKAPNPLVIKNSTDESSDIVNKPELVQTRFRTGEIQIERWVVENRNGDYVNHGDYVEFDSQGHVLCTGKFHLGKRTGSWSRLLSAKQLRGLIVDLPKGFKAPFESKAVFTNGKLSKDWNCTDANGNLVFLWNFKNGQRDGESILLNAQGQTISSIHFKEDLAHGPAIVVPPAEKPAELHFENGLQLKVVTEYYPQQTSKKRFVKSQKTYLVPSRLNIKSHDWVNSRVVACPVLEHKPIPHGPFVSYYPNGQKEFQGRFAQGDRHGEFSWWYANGQKRVSGRYDNDAETGAWSWWHDNGIRMARGTYSNGVKVQQWSTWNEDGKLTNRLVPSLDAPKKLPERIAELPDIGSTIK